MILKGSQRGNAAQLARHLMNVRDNEHVELYELRGFVAEELDGALLEAEAIARGTRCKQCLFSLSLNPPANADVSVAEFEAAVEMAESRLGLEGQPRAIVFHEKEGRRHAHVVWSRIDGAEMKAVPLPFYKRRLMDVSKELYLTHQWEMPRGLIDQSLRNPLNFTRAEWQQARRVQHDPRLIKAMFQSCWERSDSAGALQNALEEHGYWLARGDRRGHVVVDFRGEVYALARWSGVKTKEVRARLGDPKELPSVEEIRGRIAERMTDQLHRYVQEVDTGYRKLEPSAEFKRLNMVQRHRDERAALEQDQRARWEAETQARSERLPKGLGGLWSRVTGKYAKIRRQNEYEAWQALQRDRAEKDQIISRQLEERRELQTTIDRMRENRAQEVKALNKEIAEYVRMQEERGQSLSEIFGQKAGKEREAKGRDVSRKRGLYRGGDDALEPEL